MKIPFLFLGLYLGLLIPLVAQNKTTNSTKREVPSTQCVAATVAPSAGEIRTVAEGQQSNINAPFITVIRDSETYQLLRAEIAELPAMSDADFKSQTIIAAFLGERPTSGYQTQIHLSGNVLSIGEIRPPKDSMSAQVITAPYKIVALDNAQTARWRIAPDKTFSAACETYRVESGGFTYSGGIAGRQHSYELAGTIGFLRFGQMVTALFDLQGVRADKARELQTATTGKINAGEMFELPRLPAETLVESPAAPLKATGIWLKKNDKLSLKFSALPTVVADGYSGEGELTAVRESKK